MAIHTPGHAHKDLLAIDDGVQLQRRVPDGALHAVPRLHVSVTVGDWSVSAWMHQATLTGFQPQPASAAAHRRVEDVDDEQLRVPDQRGGQGCQRHALAVRLCLSKLSTSSVLLSSVCDNAAKGDGTSSS